MSTKNVALRSRKVGRLGTSLSEIGLGTWQLGGDWAHIDEAKAESILEAAVAGGVTMIDTADVYGAGRSEQLIGAFLKKWRGEVFVATKLGRQTYPGPYTKDVVRQHVTDSLGRLGVEQLDLVQLHCVPPEVLTRGEIFDWLRELQTEGLIAHFGASVESMKEANSILDVPGLATLQIIFNIFRQKPIRTLFDAAHSRGIGLIVRLPLASGLLSGTFSAATTFAEDDHRHYNRDGDAFNVGETFAGLPFEVGVAFADLIKAIVPEGMTMAQFAQRWILDHEAVSTVITGASSVPQVRDNIAASRLPPLPPALHEVLAGIYEGAVHDQIRGVY